MRLSKWILTAALLLLLMGCSSNTQSAHIAATTGPVAQFAEAIAAGTEITVVQVITDEVSCLHDYSLSVRQMEALTASQAVLLSGAGLEETMTDALRSVERVYDCSSGVFLLETDGHGHQEHGEEHEHDPHIWLDPANAAIMAENICAALTELYPTYEDTFRSNTDALAARLQALQVYGENALASLSCRELITFHDGFSYFAHAFGLEIAAAIEEESGSEASAAELIAILDLVETHSVPAVFTEVNGSVSAADIIEAEVGTPHFALDMAMNGDYFAAMTHNIDTLKEALS